MSSYKKYIPSAVALGLGLVGGAIILGGCAGETKQSTPDPTSDHIRMVAPKEIVGFSAGFRNVAIACDSLGDLIFVTSRGSDLAGGPNGGGLASGIFVVPGHEACKR